jgi:uncharacterized glyoxalase superfamily protein PhnB
MKDTPKGWPRISSSLFYDDASKAIDWLCRAFGFEVRLRVEGEGGRIVHSELEFGDGLIMIGSTGGTAEHPSRVPCRSPQSLGGANTQALCIVVDDVDEHCERARAAGAEILQEPETHDYGDDYWADRTYLARDPEGHHWWFLHRVREQKSSAS